ncbi:MAG: hypothetical protein HDT20_09490 [Oscillibacter sp.]|nr:hypothetical protein [Oscillibacter sp.]
MKRTKKLLALVMAMVMAFSCMTMPAMAHGHEDDGIMPLVERIRCPQCGGGAEYQEKHDVQGDWARIVCLNYGCYYDSNWFKV